MTTLKGLNLSLQRLGPKKERICASVLGLKLVDLRDGLDNCRAYTLSDGWPHGIAVVFVRHEVSTLVDYWSRHYVDFNNKVVVPAPNHHHIRELENLTTV